MSNINNIVAQHRFQQNLVTARGTMQLNLVLPDNPPQVVNIAFVMATNAIWKSTNDVPVGDIVLLPTLATSVPTYASLSDAFQMATFKVTASQHGYLTVVRHRTLYDDNTEPMAESNASVTYGPSQPLRLPRDAEDANPPTRLLVAQGELELALNAEPVLPAPNQPPAQHPVAPAVGALPQHDQLQ